MAKVDPLRDRKRHVMRQAAERWQKRSRGQKVLEQLSALGGEPAEFDTPLRQRQFMERSAVLQRAAELRELGRLPIGLERKIGSTLDFIQNAPSEAARKAGRPVVRIVTSCDPGVQAVGFATGFLVAPRLLLTNWHVFDEPASARGNGANFFYEHGEGGVALGELFEIDPDFFFLSNERLDFALVGIKRTSVLGKDLGDVIPATVTDAPAKILVGQPVNIVQHPDGGPKTWVTMNENRVIDVSDDGFLQYTADTLQGSSGSPVFSKAWELVGLHHSGVPETHDGKIVAVDGSEWNEDMGDDKVHWIANEGIRISALLRSLAETRLSDSRQQSVLDAFLEGSSDPVDDVRDILESSGETTTASARPLTLAGNGAAMTFTGPVTIIVGDTVSERLDRAGALERVIRFDPDYPARKGYQADFLGDGLIVPAPGVAKSRRTEMLIADGEVQVFRYHHYSLAMNSRRRLLMWSAANVDYDPERRKVRGRTTFGTDKWIYDPRLPVELQIGDRDFYEPAGQSDRGHVVRRQDSAWGESPEEVEFANSDTFHWTNCTPQHAAFNRAAAPSKYQMDEGIWGGFEVYTQSQLQKGETRACVLAGPVLSDDDPVEDFGRGPVAIPVRFWKVVVVKKLGTETPELEAHGFILSQKDLLGKFGIEFAAGRFERFRSPLREISKAAGVTFDPVITAAQQRPG